MELVRYSEMKKGEKIGIGEGTCERRKNLFYKGIDGRKEDHMVQEK
jgi:hypothetical protein